jgi:tetratricopeptide (TPR) repeat protein
MAPRFWNMLTRLSDGAPGREAFDKAFEDISLLEIAGAYDQMLLDHGESPVPVKFFPPPEPRIEEREMGDGEVHALWARLLAGQATRARSAADELEYGESDEPASLPFRYARASILLQTAGAGSVGDDVRALLAVERANPRYLLLALLEARRAYRDERDGARKDTALVKVQGLANELQGKAVTAAQQSLTGAVLGEIGEPKKAAALVEKATRTDPGCGSCFGIQAQISFAAGELDRAEEAAQRALRLLPDGARASDLEALLSRIGEERRRRSKREEARAPGEAPRAGAAGP